MVGEPKHLTVEEIAEELRVQPRTVRVWLTSGQLHGVKAGRQWRVKRVAERFAVQVQTPMLDRLDRRERAAHQEHLERRERDEHAAPPTRPEYLAVLSQTKAALVALLSLLFPEGQPVYPRTRYGWPMFPLAQMNQLLESEGLVLHARKTRDASQLLSCTDVHGQVERVGLSERR